jgi:3alpha(or 20beta)-hydroxysteroid dehydrogenase
MSDNRLAGRVVLVTGGASGMGAAQAELFAAHGASVLIADLDGPATSALAEKIGPSALGCILDVREESHWTAALELAQDSFGRPVDGLVNNAGIGGGASTVVDTDPDRYLKVVTTNQVGALLAIRTCAPVMVAAGGGSIVLNSSVLGINGHRNLGAYVSTKFAIRGLAKVAALELAADRVRVNCLCPGTVDTPMLRGKDNPASLDRLATQLPGRTVARPEDIATAALFLISHESGYVSGTDLVVDGAMTATIPLNLSG